MKKAFDQTFRDIKREVNKKVLKVPSIEQKVLDATSNEPWGPHGTLLAEIAEGSRNYHEYQMTMVVIWKRVNDTGKNWRHVYKALIVLEYLVAHGTERVIDEIKEHAYQIQTLSDFQYIDSSGRDQGNNVRRKSQSLVVLVNDKERIQEVRQKAAANREKYCNTSAGSMYRPGGYGGYEDDRYDGRYGSRDEERNSYGKEREWGYRDDDRSGRYSDSYRDGDRYGKGYDDYYSRDGNKDDDYRGRSRSIDDYQNGLGSTSSDRDQERAYEDGQHSSRGSVKGDDPSQDGRRLERKFSEQNLGAPPTYEDVVAGARSPTYSEQGGEIPSAHAPKSSSPPASASPGQAPNASAPQPAPGSPPPNASASPPPPPPPPPPVSNQKEKGSFDEFDPRGSFSAAPTTSIVPPPTTAGSVEMDLLGSFSDSFSANSLALVPPAGDPVASETDAFGNSGSVPTFVVPTSGSSTNQTFDDPFGDGPFKAIPSIDDIANQPQTTASVSSYYPTTNQNPDLPQPVGQKAEIVNNFDNSFPGSTYSTSNGSTVQQPSAANNVYSHQEPSLHQNIDILADILPPSGPQSLAISQAAYSTPLGQSSPGTGFPPLNNQSEPETGFPRSGPTMQTSFPNQSGFHAQHGQPTMQTSFQVQSGQLVSHPNFYSQATQPASQNGFPVQVGQTSFPSQSGQPASVGGFPSQMIISPQTGFQAHSRQQSTNFYGSCNPQMGSTGPATSPRAPQVSTELAPQHNSMNLLSQSNSATLATLQVTPQSPHVQSNSSVASQTMLPASTGSLVSAPQPAKDKFETKSTVWADTLSRGLVNLNISGPKINPLSDIGIDFDAINRKEKRLEKHTPAPVTSTITMGKAMGSGSGIGRAGASALRAPPNVMVGAGMGMGMGMGNMGGGPGQDMGMGSYGAPNQPMGPMMGMNMPPNMGMGMNMGIAQGGQMQRPMGFAPGPAMQGYNPMMGTGNYGQQQYGGGFR